MEFDFYAMCIFFLFLCEKIAIPSFSGAMENFGAIVYMEIWLLIEESQTGAGEVRTEITHNNLKKILKFC